MSSTSSIEIDPRSPIPLHEQVAAALRRAIAEGEAGPGERLPPARDLAGVLGVNANTVFRALRTLRDEGLLEFRRGRGVTVTGEAPQRSTLVERAPRACHARASVWIQAGRTGQGHRASVRRLGMKMLDLDSVADPVAAGPDVEVESLIIKEARRRQRRRYLFTALALVVVLAAALVVFTNLSGARPEKSKPKPSAPTAPVSVAISGIDSSLLMWPAGAPVFTQNGGPPAYLDNLRTGNLAQIRFAISAGDYQPLLLHVDQWIVYVGADGATAIRDDLRGSTRVLGSTPFFAPSATSESVWLESGLTGKVTVRLVRVTGGAPGPAITLPNGTLLVEGTDAGFLLSGGALDRLQLWTPGKSPRTLPYSPSFNDGFAASPLLIAYGSECSNSNASSTSSEPNASYEACRTLRVLNVVTGTLLSFPTPPGTRGWVPNGIGLVDAIAPGNTLVAAEAATLPSGNVRLFILRLTGSHRTPTAVPSSTSFLFARTAWSPDGSWLLYQGPKGNLWAYEATTGTVETSSAPCCQYTVMVALPNASAS